MLLAGHLEAVYHFFLVAETGSFTAAAVRLGMSQSGVSRSVRSLEEHLGLKLLQRSTRSLSPTPAGQSLLAHARTAFSALDNGLAELDFLRDTPAGRVRITASRHAIEHILLPKLAGLAQRYPQIQAELIEDARFVDIVAEGFDAGVRLGSDVQEGMVAVRISRDLHMAAVASPDYLARHGTPQHPHDLRHHRCLAYRMQNGSDYVWTFDDRGENLRITPNGWCLSDSSSLMQAALQGIGIAYEPQELVEDELQSGRLVRLLVPYCRSLPGFFLYYPDRRVPPALRVVIDELRLKSDD